MSYYYYAVCLRSGGGPYVGISIKNNLSTRIECGYLRYE